MTSASRCTSQCRGFLHRAYQKYWECQLKLLVQFLLLQSTHDAFGTVRTICTSLRQKLEKCNKRVYRFTRTCWMQGWFRPPQVINRYLQNILLERLALSTAGKQAHRIELQFNIALVTRLKRSLTKQCALNQWFLNIILRKSFGVLP